MFRLFYRYTRRGIRRKLSDEYLTGSFAQDATKWWFDFAQYLIVAALIAYYAQRTGSWFAYAVAHFCFIFFAIFLFHPAFRFVLRAAHTSKFKVRRKRVTTMSMSLFLNALSVGMGVAIFTIFKFSQFQVP